MIFFYATHGQICLIFVKNFQLLTFLNNIEIFLLLSFNIMCNCAIMCKLCVVKNYYKLL